MSEKIFVGGFGGSGTRVIQMILERAGYDVGTVNEFYDWYGNDFVPIFDAWYFSKSDILRTFMQGKLGDAESFAIKVGLLMYCIPELKEWSPGSKFIYVYRNPWDQMSNTYETHIRYGRLPRTADLVQKVQYWCEVSRSAMAQANLSVSLERLVVVPEVTVQKILDLAQVDDAPEKYTNIIQKPATMGRASNSYTLISQLPKDMQEWLRGVPGVMTEYDVF